MNRHESYWDRYESQANNFAADLLMPEKLIRSIGQKTINEYMEKHNAKMPLDDFISTMAVHFHVSQSSDDVSSKELWGWQKKSCLSAPGMPHQHASTPFKQSTRAVIPQIVVKHIINPCCNSSFDLRHTEHRQIIFRHLSPIIQSALYSVSDASQHLAQ